MVILGLIILFIIWENYNLSRKYGTDSIKYEEWRDARFGLLMVPYFIILLFFAVKDTFLFLYVGGLTLAALGLFKFKSRWFSFAVYMGILWYYLESHAGVESCIRNSGDNLWGCL